MYNPVFKDLLLRLCDDAVFKEYDPDFVSRSLDEAYLDVTKTCQLRNMSGAEVRVNSFTKDASE